MKEWPFERRVWFIGHPAILQWECPGSIPRHYFGKCFPPTIFIILQKTKRKKSGPLEDIGNEIIQLMQTHISQYRTFLATVHHLPWGILLNNFYFFFQLLLKLYRRPYHQFKILCELVVVKWHFGSRLCQQLINHSASTVWYLFIVLAWAFKSWKTISHLWNFMKLLNSPSIMRNYDDTFQWIGFVDPIQKPDSIWIVLFI